MSVLGSLIIAFAKVISLIANMYTFIIAGSAIVSWVNPDPYNPIVRFLKSATDPLFNQIRKRLPAAFFKSGIDFTPMLVIIAIVFLETILTATLMDIGISLRSR